MLCLRSLPEDSTYVPLVDTSTHATGHDHATAQLSYALPRWAILQPPLHHSILLLNSLFCPQLGRCGAALVYHASFAATPLDVGTHLSPTTSVPVRPATQDSYIRHAARPFCSVQYTSCGQQYPTFHYSALYNSIETSKAVEQRKRKQCEHVFFLHSALVLMRGQKEGNQTKML